MDISNIQAGEIYKNYKELCSILGEQQKTSNSKNAQLKEWERYFSYSRDGHKFIINEIYNSPQPKQDARSQGNNRKYESISITHPEIVKFLEPSYNGNHNIENISQYSNINLIWICSKCNCFFEKGVHNVCKSKKVLCTVCSMSKGERDIFQFLSIYKIENTKEFTFNELVGISGNLLRFDFAIFNNGKLIGLIEYDGEYHDRNLNKNSNNYEYTRKHDILKDGFCIENNLPLLRINHNEYKKLSLILARFLINVNLSKDIKKMIYEYEILRR